MYTGNQIKNRVDKVSQNHYFRQAISKLMSITPLAEHIDLKDHYLAFIDLDNFGIQNELPDERF